MPRKNSEDAKNQFLVTKGLRMMSNSHLRIERVINKPSPFLRIENEKNSVLSFSPDFQIHSQ